MTELPNKQLRILNWNIAKINHSQYWQQEFSIIQRQQPHLCFFQEARLSWPEARTFSSGQDEPKRTSADFGWHFAPNLIYHRQKYAAGVLTASVTPALTSVALHSQHQEPFLQTRKLFLVTQYPIAQQRQTLWTINVHGINFVRSHMFQSQLHQIEQAITQHSGPIILAGDFNTWRPKRMQMLQSIIQRLGLKPVNFSSNCQNNLKRFLFSDPLDHIFYRGLSLRPHSAKVLNQLTSSDHKPMVAEFNIISE
ncbi:MAG: endonuclease/exonuclease/phosphatase family protein [Cyanobacteria bacterium P01_D01_bin.1]